MSLLLLSRVLNSRHRLAILAALGGVLLWLAWPTKPLAFLLFIGFVPLLLMEYVLTHIEKRDRGGAFFRYSYLMLLIWNALSTYWVMYSTVPGGIAAIVLNALLMSAPVMAFYHTKKAFGSTVGYISFIVYWLAFEYIHLSWDLTWPWLTLGNGFAELANWVQWYEYTGFMGGSLWVLAVNVLVFLALRPGQAFQPKKLLAPALLVLLPIAISYLIYFNYKEQGEDVEVVVVQPNIDPYKEKFPGAENFVPYEQQLARLIGLSEEKITPKTKFVVWPETALTQGFWEETIYEYAEIQQLRAFLSRHPGLEIVTGIDTYKSYPSKEEASDTYRFREDIGFYDVFNTGLHMDQSGKISVYHKSKLVPGVEKLPYPGVFKFLGPLAIDLGGTVGSVGSQEERTVFFYGNNTNNNISAAPVICYESVYGDFVSGYVRNGASLIFIITNDGWWSDSPGYKQHLRYARLRAIETRRSIARSANTGISAFINQKGEIEQTTDWWVPASLRQTIKANTKQTVYTRTGELIGTSALWLGLFGFVAMLVKRIAFRIKN